MTHVILHPALVFVLSFVTLWLAAAGGALLNQGRHFGEGQRQDFGLILAASLTLLGLLLGFSFSMAASRYDQRKNLEEAEANAIGTEYLRADLLPAADRAKLRELLARYVELRLQFYTASEADVGRINAETARLQSEMWSAVLPAATAQPNAVVALAVAGMNDVINAQGYTQAAWWNRIPTSAGILMAAIAICCNVLVGYGSRSVSPRSPLLLILPLLVALAFMLIDDIDTPRHGLIHVAPRNLASLLGSIAPR